MTEEKWYQTTKSSSSSKVRAKSGAALLRFCLDAGLLVSVRGKVVAREPPAERPNAWYALMPRAGWPWMLSSDCG